MDVPRLPLRLWLAIALVALGSLYTSFQLYTPRSGPVDVWGVAKLKERFKVLEGEVPSDTVLGYVSDSPPDAGTMFGLQYAIAPRLLDKEPHRFILGNFSQPVDYKEFGRSRGLVVVKEFPQGVVLFETKAAQ